MDKGTTKSPVAFCGKKIDIVPFRNLVHSDSILHNVVSEPNL